MLHISEIKSIKISIINIGGYNCETNLLVWCNLETQLIAPIIRAISSVKGCQVFVPLVHGIEAV